MPRLRPARSAAVLQQRSITAPTCSVCIASQSSDLQAATHAIRVAGIRKCVPELPRCADMCMTLPTGQIRILQLSSLVVCVCRNERRLLRQATIVLSFCGPISGNSNGSSRLCTANKILSVREWAKQTAKLACSGACSKGQQAACYPTKI